MDIRLISSVGYQLWSDVHVHEISVCEPELIASQEGALHTRPIEIDGPNLIASQGGKLHVRIVIPK
jgi:hypothetical protein